VFSHVAVQVDNLSATIESLSQMGLGAGPVERPGGRVGLPKSGADARWSWHWSGIPGRL